MEHLPLEEVTEFPACGSRARQWRRFEDGLQDWLSTPEGRFSTWCARRLLDDADSLVSPR
jgi:hypothetical protein